MIHATAVRDVVAADWDLLDPGEQARAHRKPDPAPFVTAHAALRRVVGRHLGMPPREVGFARQCTTCGSTAHGKPVVIGHPATHVSLSYGNGVALVGLATAGELGIDVEDVTSTDFAGFDAVTLAPDERADLGALAGSALLEARAQVWARKEAVLKATGHGLAIDPTRVVVSGPHQPARLVRWDADQPAPAHLAVHDVELADRRHRAAIALLAPGAVDLVVTDRSAPSPGGWPAP